MSVEVSVLRVEPSPTAVVKGTTTWAEWPIVWGRILGPVWDFLKGDAPKGLWTHGHNVFLYLDQKPTVEVGVQVTGPFEPHGDVVPSATPGGLVATATHVGPIGAIGDTHGAVRDWAKANGYTPTGVLWEVYGDPKPPTMDFDVDVFWLLEDS